MGSKGEESGGVMAMIDLLVKDLEKEMTEAESDEKHSQASYETMMKESTDKRASDSKSLSGKVSTLADTESELVSLKEDKKAAGSEMMALQKYIGSLHSECDWRLQYHDVRKEARSGRSMPSERQRQCSAELTSRCCRLAPRVSSATELRDISVPQTGLQWIGI